MTRFTDPLWWLSLALSVAFGAQAACAAESFSVKQPLTRLQKSIVGDPQTKSKTKTDDQAILKRMLSPRQHKHLRFASDLEGLTDNTVSQSARSAS
jgi:hypothetical protein